jgi:hypothetical protein
MKSADAYENEREISNALASLAIGEVPPQLAALAQAVRAGDWQGISNAALYHKLTDPATQADEHFNLARLQWIANHPEAFGLEEVTKADVETILAEVMHQPMPPNKTEAWKRAGLDRLPQGRGRALASVEKMRRAYQAFRDEAKGSSIASREALRLLSILDGLKPSI